MREGDEQKAADDRPHDGERMAPHGDDQKLGQVKHPRDPSAQECTQKAEEDRQNETAAGSTAEAPRDCATDSSDDEVYDELEHGHGYRRSNDDAVFPSPGTALDTLVLAPFGHTWCIFAPMIRVRRRLSRCGNFAW